jgi:hypothetical protein
VKDGPAHVFLVSANSRMAKKERYLKRLENTLFLWPRCEGKPQGWTSDFGSGLRAGFRGRRTKCRGLSACCAPARVSS